VSGANAILRVPESPAESLDGIAAGFRALNAFFDRVVVITLRRATRRHEQLDRALAGLRYELFYGTDQRDLDLGELTRLGRYDANRARRLHRFGRAMSLGEIACVMSHMAVWRQVASEPHSRVLVLEDDAIPCPKGLPEVGRALAELPRSWELVYLGFWRNENVTLRRRLDRRVYMALGSVGLHYLSARESSNVLPRPFSEHLRRAGLHYGTYAYALTPVAAERLLRFQQPIALAADTGITRVILRGEIEAYVTAPKAFGHDGPESFVRPSGMSSRA
jgi:glycosyl transferase family 25